jgi:hypothetical protein
MDSDFITCSMCKRETPINLAEEHHLIPRSIASRNKYAKMPQLEKGKETIRVCVSCGDQLHQLFTDKELGEDYNTLEKIVANKQVQNWIKWIGKKPNDFSVCMKAKKRR